MSNKEASPIAQPEMVTLNIQPLLMPISMLLSSIILTSGLIIAANTVVSGGTRVAGVTTTGTTQTTGTTVQQPTTAGTPSVSVDTIRAQFTNNNITFGDPNSKLLFLEVADPSCPYCHIAAGKNSELNKQAGTQFLLTKDGGNYVAPVPEMKKLVDEGKAAYTWIYSNGHGNGELATKALYCAHEKGKFWQVHDLLYTNAGYNLINNVVKNDSTKAKDLAEFLKSAIDPAELQTCLGSGKYDGRIAADQQVAASLGVNGTPGYFVNGTNFAGAYGFTDMQAAVNAALGN
jgi:protein-disulfide isomerase